MKRRLIITQDEASDCGACCLLSIIRYYGEDASLENIRMYSETTHSGVSALNLINCAKRYGFDAKGLRVERIPDDCLPIIAHVNISASLSHFVVIYSITKTCVEIMDPSVGMRSLKIDDFYQIFTGNIILLSPKNLIHENIDNKAIIDWIKGIYLKAIKEVLFISITAIFTLSLSLTINLYLNIALLLNNGFNLLIIFLLVLMIKEIINYFITNKKEKLIKRCTNDILENFFIHIFRLPLKYVHLKDPGEIVKRCHELEAISSFYINSILNIATNILIISTIFFILFKIFFLSFNLTIICLTIYMLFVLYINLRINRRIDTNINSSTSYQVMLCDYISKIKSIRHTNNDAYFLNNLRSVRSKYLDDDICFKKKIHFNNMIKNIIIGFFILLNNYFILKYYYLGVLKIDMVIAINTLFANALMCIQNIEGDIPGFIYYHKILRRLNEFMFIEEDRNDSHKFIGGSIYAKNLTYSYNKLNSSLNIPSLYIGCHDKVFVTGPNGDGKSTLCGIIAKDLSDYKGTIKIGKNELKSLSLQDIHEHIGYCSQDEQLFIGTIKENIILGRDVSDADFKRVCKICLLDEIMDHKPFKYDTYLYGVGSELSGGERNLILLARCLVAKKDIYILDEVLANLSKSKEERVIQNILKYYHDQMIIYVSHRDTSKYFSKVLNV